mmetsp:Transcript_38426/g.59980  ORF Transcript_38426/g.59980 Transcript_38426/m.59980 type:complete len:273 (-) Transcript_38426:208-1026(-)
MGTEIAALAQDNGLTVGRVYTSVAAGCILMALLLRKGCPETRKDGCMLCNDTNEAFIEQLGEKDMVEMLGKISEATGAAEATIKQTYKDLLPHRDKLIPSRLNYHMWWWFVHNSQIDEKLGDIAREIAKNITNANFTESRHFATISAVAIVMSCLVRKGCPDGGCPDCEDPNKAKVDENNPLNPGQNNQLVHSKDMNSMYKRISEAMSPKKEEFDRLMQAALHKRVELTPDPFKLHWQGQAESDADHLQNITRDKLQAYAAAAAAAAPTPAS